MALQQPGINNTGKKTHLKGIFATTDNDVAQGNKNVVGSAPGRPLIAAKWDPNSNAAAAVQSEALARQAARRARGVIEDDEPQNT